MIAPCNQPIRGCHKCPDMKSGFTMHGGASLFFSLISVAVIGLALLFGIGIPFTAPELFLQGNFGLVIATALMIFFPILLGYAFYKTVFPILDGSPALVVTGDGVRSAGKNGTFIPWPEFGGITGSQTTIVISRGSGFSGRSIALYSFLLKQNGAAIQNAVRNARRCK